MAPWAFLSPRSTWWQTALGKVTIVVTCTPAKAPLLSPEDLMPGTFVAAVGADSTGQNGNWTQGSSRRPPVVTEVTAQCAHVGELYHAIAAGLMEESDVHAELGEVVAGRKPGRRGPEEIVVYDATGTALQHGACAAAIYVKAMDEGSGASIAFG